MIEIDDVRTAIEWPNTDLDDRHSDMYFKMVERATRPSPLGEYGVASLVRCRFYIGDHNDDIRTQIEHSQSLWGTPLLEAYYSTLRQVDEILDAAIEDEGINIGEAEIGIRKLREKNYG